MMNGIGLLVVCLLLCCPAFADDIEVLRLATTTSTFESGLLDHILPVFESQHGCRVHIISVGTGKAMQIARNGDVDVVLVHARAAEDRFVAEGHGVNRRNVMVNDFVLLGPVGDPARAGEADGAPEALKRIASQGQRFVSRGDDSGTHKREKLLWGQAAMRPSGAWYLEAGQGMSAALRMADEKDAYVLVDRATYLKRRHALRLTLILEGGDALSNPYGIIAVSPYRYPHVRYELAMALVAWITSPRCQEMIGAFELEGAVLFHPDAAPGTP